MAAMRRLLACLLIAVATAAAAADHLVVVDTRPGVRLGYYLMARIRSSSRALL